MGGSIRTDLLINKIDLGPIVGASLDILQRETPKMRGEQPSAPARRRGGRRS